MLEARELIEAAYGIRISSIKPNRAGYILDTDKGKKYFVPASIQKAGLILCNVQRNILLPTVLQHWMHIC